MRRPLEIAEDQFRAIEIAALYVGNKELADRARGYIDRIAIADIFRSMFDTNPTRQ